MKQRVESVGNVLCTWGLNQLIEQLSAGTDGFAAPWVQCAVIGTSATVYVSTMDSVSGATASKSMGASMVASDTGSMSLQYRITFDDANAYTAKEVGLMGSNVSNSKMVAAKSFADVVKGAADTINVSYTIIAGTA